MLYCILVSLRLSFQYYAHRAKMAIVDREKDIEAMNRTALKIAREVADDTGTLMAGNICNTTLYNPDNPEWKKTVANMFKVNYKLFARL